MFFCLFVFLFTVFTFLVVSVSVKTHSMCGPTGVGPARYLQIYKLMLTSKRKMDTENTKSFPGLLYTFLALKDLKYSAC